MKERDFPVKAALQAAVIFALAGCASMPAGAPPVTFEPEMALVQAADTAQSYHYDLTVAEDEKDFAESALEQRYALLGREDLTARTSDEYRSAACEAHPSGATGEDGVLDAIVAGIGDARVVIVNESHLVSRHRGFSAALAERLRPLGFTHFGAETFDNRSDPRPVIEGMAMPYPRDIDGYYSAEAGFGRLLRTVKGLGYIPFAYEDNMERDRTASVAQRIAWREEFQAAAIAQMLETAGPDARLLVHVGYSHAQETPVRFRDGREDYWMAARLKRDHGIDPVTISQFQCRDEAGPVRLAGEGPDAPPGAFDFVVAHPVTRFAGGRPLWRERAGDVRVPVPAELRPVSGAHVVEARLSGEPDEAIPMDRVLVYPDEEIDLLLPPGRYRLRAVVALTQAPD